MLDKEGEASMPGRGSDDFGDEVTFEDYLDSVEPVLTGFGMATKRSRRGLLAMLNIDKQTNISLTFKKGRSFEALWDFHHAGQNSWLEQIFGRRIKNTEIFKYVHRLGVEMPILFLPEKKMRKPIYHLKDRLELVAFAQCLKDELENRAIPFFLGLTLKNALDVSHPLRIETCGLRRMTPGGILTSENMKTMNEIENFNAIDRDEWEVSNEQKIQIECWYWRKGAFLDLSAMLALDETEQAKTLIGRMPDRVDVYQHYYLHSERVDDDLWRTARGNVDQIAKSL